MRCGVTVARGDVAKVFVERGPWGKGLPGISCSSEDAAHRLGDDPRSRGTENRCWCCPAPPVGVAGAILTGCRRSAPSPVASARRVNPIVSLEPVQNRDDVRRFRVTGTSLALGGGVRR